MHRNYTCKSSTRTAGLSGIFQALTGFRTTDERNLPLTKTEDVLALTENKGKRKGKEKKSLGH